MIYGAHTLDLDIITVWCHHLYCEVAWKILAGTVCVVYLGMMYLSVCLKNVQIVNRMFNHSSLFPVVMTDVNYKEDANLLSSLNLVDAQSARRLMTSCCFNI